MFVFIVQRDLKISRGIEETTPGRNNINVICSYATVRLADLTKRKRKHSGKKAYKCDVCSYSAARIDTPETRMKKTYRRETVQV